MRETTSLASFFKKVFWNPLGMPTGCPSVVSLFHPVSPTGKTIWTLNLIHLSSGFLAAPAAILPDVDGDGTRDIVVLALKETQVQHSPVWGLKGP